jgi:hypothetical protein
MRGSDLFRAIDASKSSEQQVLNILTVFYNPAFVVAADSEPLLDADAVVQRDLNAPDPAYKSMTPLYYACDRDHPNAAVIRLLLSFGASPSVLCTAASRSPLFVVGQSECRKLRNCSETCEIRGRNSNSTSE